MLNEDVKLQIADIQSLKNIDTIASFFASLGYDVQRLSQSPSALHITDEKLLRHIHHIEQIAIQDGELYIYLFVMKSMRVADRQALAKVFRNAEGESYFLAITSDFESIDFVLLERVLPFDDEGNTMVQKQVMMQQHVLTVKQADLKDKRKARVPLRVLRRFTNTESDVLYQIEKLLSAYKVAKWSRPMFNNLALFSDHYLENRLEERSEWDEDPLPIYNQLNGLFVKVRERLGDAPEEQTRSELLEPILESLGFTLTEPQINREIAQPDYYLSIAGDNKPLTYILTYRWNRYLDGRDMSANGQDSQGLDAQKKEDNPGARVVSLMAQEDSPAYIIVTNGKLWRLYGKEAHSRSTNYYEIDLEETLTDTEREETIRYFWLFFRALAFAPQVTVTKGISRSQSFLDRVRLGSIDYAKTLELNLKNSVFDDIFPQFAEGFIRNRWGSATPSQPELDMVYQGTLTFLYRLMFLLYAESRDLLPIHEERGYLDISLKRLKENIANHAKDVIDKVAENLKSAYKPTTTELYDQLTNLFEVIDHGNPDLNVPHYNGGLFVTNPNDNDDSPDAQNARFLRDTKIPDFYLSLGLDRLARDVDDSPSGGLVAIDYKSLGVSQLGSIYEGLLEFKLRIAPEKMAIVKSKKDKVERIVPYGKTAPADIVMEGRGKEKTEKTLPKGTVYLENTKQERKASGSYYTPDYIVKYIVQHTVGPVLEAKFAALTPRMRAAEQHYFDVLQDNRDRAKRGLAIQNPELVWNNEDMRQLATDVLDIKVLDPAMGSGHFLVEVVDFVTDRILKFLDRFRHNPVESQLRRVRESILENMDSQDVYIDEKRLTDINLLKRQVLKRVVYGVDLNRMAVELAKVSLWLDAFTLGAPLSFLDHHLRWGNSLIGAFDLSNAVAEGSSRWNEIARGAAKLGEISQSPDVTENEVVKSKEKYKQARVDLEPTLQRLNVQITKHFGVADNTGSAEQYAYLSVEGRHARDKHGDEVHKDAREKFEEAQRIAKEQRFFHWKLEFPEVFVDVENNTWRKDAGFDAIVGNPPYDVIKKEKGNDKKNLVIDYYRNSDLYKPALGRVLNLFRIFVVRSMILLQPTGMFGKIIPLSFLSDESASKLRKEVTEATNIFLLECFPQKDNPKDRVFEDAKLSTLIVVAKIGDMTNSLNLRVHPGKHILSDSPVLSISISSIKRFDENNLTIPVALPKELLILERFFSGIYAPMSDYVNVLVGEIDMTIDADCKTNIYNPNFPILLKGAQVQRYELRDKPKQGDLEWVKWNTFTEKYKNSGKLDVANSPRMVFQGISGTDDSRRLTSTVIEPKIYLANSVNYTVPRNVDLSLYYIQALFGSQLLEWRFRLTSTNNNINNYEVESLPFRIIEFKTPLHERKLLQNAILQHYKNNNEATSLVEIKSVLDAGKTDVIHDVLAHLAQVMSILNKDKQAEITRFLGWLETQLGAKIEDFSGKTIIQGYLGDYQKGELERPFDDILDQLLKSPNARQMSVNIKDKTLQGKIRQVYEKSLEILRPIKEELTRTDILIDKIVYQLYGLTDEEIELVERPLYAQALAEAKTLVLEDKELQKSGDDEEKVARLAEGVLQASNLFFARVPSENYEERLNNDLPNWRNLPPEAPVFMKTGDYVLATQPEDLDFSTSVVSYTKAVETTLYQRIFIPFRQAHQEGDCQNQFLQRFMRGEIDLTLGNFPIILASSKENVLRQFIKRTFSNAEQNFYGQTGVVTFLNDKAVVGVRNDSAHDTLQGKQIAEDMREWAIQILSRI